MAEHLTEDKWSRTAWLTAHVVNAGMNAKRPVQPKDVNPVMLAKKRKRLSGKSGFSELKGMLF